MTAIKKWKMTLAIMGTVALTTTGCSPQLNILSKIGFGQPADQSVTAQKKGNQKNHETADPSNVEGADKSSPSKAVNGPGYSSDPTGQRKAPDRPWLKETIKVTADGQHIVTNPASILVCADKHRSLGDYVPKHLVVPDIPFPFHDPKKVQKAHLRKIAATAIERLFQAAKKDGIQLLGVSGYRSYDRQKAVFASNVNYYGSTEKANQVSAKPGESEHQTGLSMDVSSEKFGYRLKQQFGKTEAGKWLVNNGWKYGFIIRYPKGKEDITGYEYEPWHIRYVGKKAAKVIHEKQITLEEYLSK
ncbi:MAG TPA: M15 family metallopeptidase [Bacillales bacterium]|nr:M15 family metallopeptidase [Bacillales bacterium]